MRPLFYDRAMLPRHWLVPLMALEVIACGSVTTAPDAGESIDGPATADADIRPDADITPDATNCHGSSAFEYTGAIETFSLPACAQVVTVDAWGAQGGSGQTGGVGGLGAHALGTFSDLGGVTLRILVGGAGADGTNGEDQAGGTGGGGSFVVTDASTPLVVAGGGGGAMGRVEAAGCPCRIDGGPGQVTIDGQMGAANGGAGGVAGGGGGTWPWTGWHSGTGGGGFTGDGSAWSNGASDFGTPSGPGIAFLNGGAGGVAGSSGRAGGFGGGGSAGFTGGGGGGYSGGGSGTHDAPQTYNGGGGGSYNAGGDQVMESGVRGGAGSVVISW